MLLEVKDTTVHYYKVAAVRNISINVEDGEIVTLIGSNGAGKTTTLRAISGLKHPSAGEIIYNGQRIDKLPPYKINALGIAMVPEGRLVFPQMTVLENLLMGAFLRKDKENIQPRKPKIQMDSATLKLSTDRIELSELQAIIENSLSSAEPDKTAKISLEQSKFALKIIGAKAAEL